MAYIFNVLLIRIRFTVKMSVSWFFFLISQHGPSQMVCCHLSRFRELNMVDCTQFAPRIHGHIRIPSQDANCLRSMRAKYLQSILEQLVHLGHLGRDGQVDGAVANFDNESSLDFRVNLGDNLELLAIGDVVRLVDGGF